MRSLPFAALALLAMLVALPARADAPPFVPVQGFLTDAAGEALSGAHDVRFRLYREAEAGEAVFDESIAGISVDEGLFSVELGHVTALDLGLFETESALFLGLTIDDDSAELSPRIPLGTVPWAAFANKAGDARTLDGHSADEFVSINVSCAAGNIPFFDGTAWTCLALGGQACGAGSVVTGFDASGAVECEAPADTGVRGRSCPSGQFMTGIGDDGTPECAAIDNLARTYVNTKCFLYLGWSDDCEGTCNTPAKMGRVNGTVGADTVCETNLGSTSTDNTCGTQNNIIGTLDIRTLGINPDGDVDGNDKIFVGMHCE